MMAPVPVSMERPRRWNVLGLLLIVALPSRGAMSVDQDATCSHLDRHQYLAAEIPVSSAEKLSQLPVPMVEEEFRGHITVLYNVAPPKPFLTRRIYKERDPIFYHKIQFDEQIKLFNNLFHRFESNGYGQLVQFILGASPSRHPDETEMDFVEFDDFLDNVTSLAASYNMSLYPNAVTGNGTFAMFGLKEFQVYHAKLSTNFRFSVAFSFFPTSRGTDMVDIISNRVQEAYGSFRLPTMFGQTTTTSGDQIEGGGFSTYAMLKRFGEQKRRKRQTDKDNDRKMREESLFQMKNSPTPHIPPDVPPMGGLMCRFCSPMESQPQLTDADRRRTAMDILRMTTHAGIRTNTVSSGWDWSVWCPHLAQAARVARFEYPQLAGTVLGDERVQQSLETAAKESVNEKRAELGLRAESPDESFDEDAYYNEAMQKHEKRAEKILIGMRSKLSNLVLRITSWVLYKLLPCFISGVAAHPGQVDMIKRAIDNNPDVPLIFLPLHRSHLDYIMVSFILLNNDIKCPLVAGGDNLRIPVFGNILRYDGAFFIKRKIDPVTGKKDHVYRAILHTYLQKCLTAGHNVEFFIEGGRTRTGKPCMPKSGILSVIVDAFNDKSISDALIVPVSINYEKLVDGNFIREQLGQKKIPESFRSAAAGIMKVLKARYGLMRIDFNEPFSLSELIKSLRKSDTHLPIEPEMRRLQHKPSSSSLFGTDVVQEEQEQRHLIDNIARHVVYDCAKATAVMTTNALAFLLLNRFRDGAPLSILVDALDELRSVLNTTSRDLGFTGSSEDVIRYAADLLGPGLVTVERRTHQLFIRPVTLVPNVIELAYYSNSLVPHFALDSIIVTCASYLKRQEEDRLRELGRSTDDVSISRGMLFQTCLEYCDLLMYEFILSKPCQSLQTLLEDSFDRLCHRELLLQPEVEYTDEQNVARRLAARLELEDLDDGMSSSEDDYFNETGGDHHLLDDPIRVYLPAEKHCDRKVMQSVLAPFSSTYAAVAFCLSRLVGECSLVEGEFIRLCIQEITSRVELGECIYGESISTDTVRNCLKVLEKRSNIEIGNSNGVRMVSLTPATDSDLEVQAIIQSIERFVPV
ncbi:glycerol-3-phosphate acyltransferase 1, mitochondrial [Uranotaenia lowii]|uniref:glycerol-3-phosphate acyltransferase 1, mitochondrial n=1 Tax=Uranotaenia lowii TaxID=190385 RepID=UPI0024790D42|nr:glycerol-3-phosphate acyltransferase 1, mitochondrial [Uranotaenia lowii]